MQCVGTVGTDGRFSSLSAEGSSETVCVSKQSASVQEAAAGAGGAHSDSVTTEPSAALPRKRPPEKHFFQLDSQKKVRSYEDESQSQAPVTPGSFPRLSASTSPPASLASSSVSSPVNDTVSASSSQSSSGPSASSSGSVRARLRSAFGGLPSFLCLVQPTVALPSHSFDHLFDLIETGLDECNEATRGLSDAYLTATLARCVECCRSVEQAVIHSHAPADTVDRARAALQPSLQTHVELLEELTAKTIAVSEGGAVTEKDSADSEFLLGALLHCGANQLAEALLRRCHVTLRS